MKVIIAAVCLLTACHSEENLGFSVVGSTRWAVSLGGRANDRGMVVAVDSTGDVIAAGDFFGPADLGDGLETVGGPWAFITKRVASDGSPRWTRELLGASSMSGAYVRAIAIGAQDRIVVLGSYRGTVDFGGTTLSLPPDESRTYLATYDAQGALLWITQLNDYAQPAALAVDQAGRIFITGQFWLSTLNFNGQLFRESDNDPDSFLAAYDAQGTLLWGTAFQGAAPGTIDGAGPWSTGIAIAANGDVLVTGGFTAPVSVGGAILNPETRIRTFITRFRTDGVYLASRGIGPVAPAWSEAPAIAVDAAGKIVIQQIERPGEINQPGPWESMWPVTIRVFDDAFHEQWSSRLLNHGSESPQVRTLATTATGMIISSAWTDAPDSSLHPGSMEVVAYDPQGAVGIDSFGSRLGNALEVTIGWGNAVSADGAMAFTGAYAGTIDFGTGPLRTRGQDDTDIYIVVVDPP